MSFNLIKTVDFGLSKGSLTTIGYRLYHSDGSLSGSRVTAGTGEVLSGAGIYSASIHFSDFFSGSVLWDTGESTPTYASDDYNPTLDNVTKTLNLVSSSVDFNRHISGGRWKIDTDASQMIFYKDDNTTEVARFSLKDSDGNASTSSVFERTKA